MICKKGDTIIEVMFATAVFALVAVVGLTLMNSGVSTAQASLEITLARETVDAQAEALRMIHNSYAAQVGKSSGGLSNQWQDISSLILPSSTDIKNLNGGAEACEIPDRAAKRFVIDTRSKELKVFDSSDGIRPASTFPRLIYGSMVEDGSNKASDGNDTLLAAEGVWIQGVESVKNSKTGEFLAYDFHINACWNSPGRTAPSTIGTIVRLYNVGAPSHASSPAVPDVPREPEVSVAPLNGDKFNFSWTEIACSPGFTPQYRYKAGDASWVTTYDRAYTWTISAPGDYTLRVRARCSEFGRWSDEASKTASTPVATLPTVSVAFSSDTAGTTNKFKFDWTASTCPFSFAAQYRYKAGDAGSWVTTSNLSYTWSVSAPGSYKLQVQARCTDYGKWSESASATGKTPAAPAKPTLTGALFGGNIPGFKASAPDCPVNTYLQYRFKVNTGSWSAATTSAGYPLTSTVEGTSYTVYVQARCSGVGDWSADGNASFERPVDISGGLNIRVSSVSEITEYSYTDVTVYVNFINKPTCSSGASLQLQMRTQRRGETFGSWYNIVSTNSYFNISGLAYAYQGYTYNVEVQARCNVNGKSSGWLTAGASWTNNIVGPTMSSSTTDNVTKASTSTYRITWGTKYRCVGSGTSLKYRYSITWEPNGGGVTTASYSPVDIYYDMVFGGSSNTIAGNLSARVRATLRYVCASGQGGNSAETVREVNKSFTRS